MGPDGTGEHPITTGTSKALGPVWSPDGTHLAYWADGHIVVSDPEGHDPIVVSGADSIGESSGQTGRILTISWAPDGTRLVYDGVTTFKLYVAAADGSGATALDLGSLLANEPAWSPDGTQIAFRGFIMADPTGDGVYLAQPDGSNVRLLAHAWTNEGAGLLAPAWSPDGQRVAYDFFQNQAADGGPPCTSFDWFYPPCSRKDIAVSPVNGNGTPTVVAADSLEENSPVWSPDGTLIAFTYGDYPDVDSSGMFTGSLHVVRPDGTGAAAIKSPILSNALNGPWSPDGTRLLATGHDNPLLIITADGSEPVISTPVTRGNDGMDW